MRGGTAGIRRDFLGWDRPVLASVADELERAAPEGRLLDLSGILLVLPGAQAGRRLKEILLERVEASGRSLRPPEIQSVGGLPELLYRPGRSQPGPLLTRVAWARALQEQGERLRILIPDTDGDGGPREVPSALVGAVRTLGRDIGAAGRDFGDVRRLCVEDDAHEDEERWDVLADVQVRYRKILAAAGYQDVSEARVEALARGEVHTPLTLWIAGVPELPVITRRFVRALAAVSPVRILVGAPPELATRFDETGCVIPSEWTEAPIEIPGSAIVVGMGPADQADVAVEAIRSFEEGCSAEDITIGVPDPEVIPYLVERLEEEEVRVRDVGGKGFEQTGIFRLLRAVERYLTSPGVRPLQDLLRHPAFESAVRSRLSSSKQSPADLIVRYQALHFQRTLAEHDLPDGGEWASAPLRPAVREVVASVGRLFEPFADMRSLSDWMPRVAGFLRTVFEAPGSEGTLAPGEAAEVESAIETVLGEAQELPRNLDSPVAAAAAISVLLEEIRDQAIAPEADPGAIPLMGWLELALDDAPNLVVTGFNEPFVPASVGADAFLPHSLRRAVGLPDNDARWARDAWVLSTALRARRRLVLVVGRRSSDGDPRLPSRLLFAADRSTVASRMAALLGGGQGGGEEPHTGSDVPASTDAGTPADAGVPHDGDDGMRQVEGRFSLPPERILSAPALPEAISVTAFSRLLKDPYHFALTDILRIRDVNLDPDELDPLVFGTLAHEVLRAFGEGPVAHAEDSRAVREFLDECLDAEVRHRFGTRHLAAVRIQVGQLRARFAEFSEWQAGWAREGWRIRATERSPADGGVPFVVDGEPILLRGKIDRIDENVDTGRWVLLDYKTGERAGSPDKTHRAGRGPEAPWVDLQLPLYRLLAAELGGPEDDPLIPRARLADLGVGYVVLPRDLDKIGVELASWGPAELAAAEEAARDAVRSLRANRFDFDPSRSSIRPGDYLADIVGAGVLQLRGAGGGERS